MRRSSMGSRASGLATATRTAPSMSRCSGSSTWCLQKPIGSRSTSVSSTTSARMLGRIGRSSWRPSASSTSSALTSPSETSRSARRRPLSAWRSRAEASCSSVRLVVSSRILPRSRRSRAGLAGVAGASLMAAPAAGSGSRARAPGSARSPAWRPRPAPGSRRAPRGSRRAAGRRARRRRGWRRSRGRPAW